MTATRGRCWRSRDPGAGAAGAASISSPTRIQRIVPPWRRRARVLCPWIARSDDEQDLSVRALLGHAVRLADLRDRQALADGNAQLSARGSLRQVAQALPVRVGEEAAYAQ